jgi:hypothetical protein
VALSWYQGAPVIREPTAEVSLGHSIQERFRTATPQDVGDRNDLYVLKFPQKNSYELLSAYDYARGNQGNLTVIKTSSNPLADMRDPTTHDLLIIARNRELALSAPSIVSSLAVAWDDEDNDESMGGLLHTGLAGRIEHIKKQIADLKQKGRKGDKVTRLEQRLKKLLAKQDAKDNSEDSEDGEEAMGAMGAMSAMEDFDQYLDEIVEDEDEDDDELMGGLFHTGLDGRIEHLQGQIASLKQEGGKEAKVARLEQRLQKLVAKQAAKENGEEGGEGESDEGEGSSVGSGKGGSTSAEDDELASLDDELERMGAMEDFDQYLDDIVEDDDEDDESMGAETVDQRLEALGDEVSDEFGYVEEVQAASQTTASAMRIRSAFVDFPVKGRLDGGIGTRRFRDSPLDDTYYEVLFVDPRNPYASEIIEAGKRAAAQYRSTFRVWKIEEGNRFVFYLVFARRPEEAMRKVRADRGYGPR